MSFQSEENFQYKVLNILKKTRSAIESPFRPFTFLNLEIDIKCINNDREEWRELKILYYHPSSKRNIQNLWKGIGKVKLMERLSERFRNDQVINFLTLSETDFSQLPKSNKDHHYRFSTDRVIVPK